jgi:hypothetical protein
LAIISDDAVFSLQATGTHQPLSCSRIDTATATGILFSPFPQVFGVSRFNYSTTSPHFQKLIKQHSHRMHLQITRRNHSEPHAFLKVEMYDKKTGTPPRRCSFGLYLVVFARYAVLAGSAIATYCLCYLVDQHNKHYCTWGWGAKCTDEQKKNIEVPWAEVIFITAVRIPSPLSSPIPAPKSSY